MLKINKVKSKNLNKPHPINNELGINDGIDFWKDANEFLKTQLPNNFQEELDSYTVTKGYNLNECRLFMSMLSDALNLYGMLMVIKKLDNK